MNGRVAVGHLEPLSRSIGPGQRFGLWVRGCRLRCPGCVSPEFQESGRPEHLVAVSDLFDLIRRSRDENGIEGVTFSGGEPFEQSSALAELAAACRTIGLSVIAWSGRLVEELRTGILPDSPRLLGQLDAVIDGPYVESLRCDEPLRGSFNQRLILLSDRYQESDFLSRNIDVRLFPGGYRIIGVVNPRCVEQVLGLLGVDVTRL